LYDTNVVPVGEDQKQHLELTRDIAEKFNARYGETFIVPDIQIQKATGRIMSLQDPLKKMSKSDDNLNGAIFLLDSAEEVTEKIKRAVTDSDNEIRYSPENKPAISNLLSIFSSVTDSPIEEIERKYSGVGYGQFKTELTEAIIEFLLPFQQRFKELKGDNTQLDIILNDGVEYAKSKSSPMLQKVIQSVGLGR